MSKAMVLKIHPEAFCVRLDNKTSYIVWPRKTQSRGILSPAIGLGASANCAWKDALKTIKRKCKK